MQQKTSIHRLLWIMLLDHMSLNMTFPLFALVFLDIHSRLFDPAVSQAVRGIYYGFSSAIPNIMVLFIAPVLSGLSDSYGRKPLLILGIGAACLFSFLAGISVLFGSLTFFLLSRIIQGFSRTNPIAQAVVGDMGSDGKKLVRMATLQSAISIAAFIGPVLGGYFAYMFFESLNFSTVFFMAGLLALFGLVVTVVFFKETLAAKRRYSIVSMFTVMRNPAVISISLLLFLCQLSWSIYYQFMPVVLKVNFHFSSVQLGWFIGLIACWLAVATVLFVPYLARLLSVQRMLTISVLLVLLGLIITMVACVMGDNYSGWLWVGAVPTAMGDVIAYSCITTLYSDCVRLEEQGCVMGVCFVIVSLAWALTGMLGGFLVGMSAMLPIVLSPVGVIVLLCFIRRVTWACP